MQKLSARSYWERASCRMNPEQWQSQGSQKLMNFVGMQLSALQHCWSHCLEDHSGTHIAPCDSLVKRTVLNNSIGHRNKCHCIRARGTPQVSYHHAVVGISKFPHQFSYSSSVISSSSAPHSVLMNISYNSCEVYWSYKSYYYVTKTKVICVALM